MRSSTVAAARGLIAAAFLGACLPLAAQDAKSWLESQGLEAGDSKAFQEFEAVLARVPGAKDAVAAQERIVVFRQGKPVWQSNPKENPEAQRWFIHSIGRDLDGDGQPELHISAYSGGAHCCTSHYVYRLKPQVRRHAVHNAGNVGGGEFLDLPGRKTPVMVSADDSSAYAFGPYAGSYFPVVIIEVSPKGRFQLAADLMQSRLPGQPPPVCAQPAAIANPWLKQRCGEYATAQRKSRTEEIKTKLSAIKSGRSADRLTWEDYLGTGLLAGASAEMNRYTYTGHGGAGLNWLETVWPGNDAVKAKFLKTLRETQAKSAFAQDLRSLASEYR